MKKKTAVSWGALAGVAAFLALIILLENITALVPGAPRVLLPTSLAICALGLASRGFFRRLAKPAPL